jgi:phage FluMu protein Com
MNKLNLLFEHRSFDEVSITGKCPKCNNIGTYLKTEIIDNGIICKSCKESIPVTMVCLPEVECRKAYENNTFYGKCPHCKSMNVYSSEDILFGVFEKYYHKKIICIDCQEDMYIHDEGEI